MPVPASPAPSTPEATCPACKAPASGKFCSACGAPLAGAECAACHAALTPGAKFCHRCGTEVGAAVHAAGAGEERGFNAALPWAVAAIALVALIAMLAGQRFARQSTAAADAAAPAGLMGAGAGGPGGEAPAGARGAAAVDISSMSPEERAIRLYNRVMSLAERGQADSVQLFAPMAIAAYQMLGPPNADQRYDLGRIGLASGDDALATAEADSILATQPNHLLGLILAADAARARNDQARARGYLRRFAAAEPAERAKQLPEYVDHANDIRLALESAKKL
ncbi:MAG TPA: zinc ribbon domain-containing protein [Gemmatimonadaceae bacterium]|nr:zinc ribbon domain-containing protein [Gemmatimonadaceae bacterium]